MEATTNSKGMRRAGVVITVIVGLFMLVDAGMKIVEATVSMEGSTALGWPVEFVQGIGFVLIACTLLYLVPRTSLYGAILMTGYLGGAISIMVRAGVPWWFPLIMGMLAWTGLLLRDAKLRSAFLSKN
jgi:hypothetical protein